MKYTIESIKLHFQQNGCKLLSKKYKNMQEKLKYICKCGEQNEVSYHGFINRKIGCKTCVILESKKDSAKQIKERAPKRILNFETIKQEFEDYGCVVLSTEYVNNRTPIKYICKCGETTEKTYNCFQYKKGCMSCTGTPKYTYEQAQNFFNEKECVLLSKTYENISSLLEYICSCGNKSKISLTNLLSGHRCRQCRIYSRIYTTEIIKQEFEKYGYTLHDPYVEFDSLMSYTCPVGHNKKISWRNFKNGRRCCNEVNIIESSPVIRELNNEVNSSQSLTKQIVEQEKFENIASSTDSIGRHEETQSLTEQNLLVKQFQENNITIYGTYDKPLFKTKDIGDLLGIKNIRDTVKNYSINQKVVVLTDTLGGQQETLFLTEQGLYKVLMKSRKPIAEKFQDWVCEVVEQIRKNGKYETEKYIQDRAKSNLLVEQSIDKSINYIGVVEESGENMIVKYGRTNYIKDTLNRHQITYGDNFYFIHTLECDRNHDLEKLIQNHINLKSRHIKSYKGTQRQELIKLDQNFTSKDLIQLVGDLKETLYDKHILDLEKEKTKQIEMQEKTKQLEAEYHSKQIQAQEKTKQLQLEFEILKLKIAHGIAP